MTRAGRNATETAENNSLVGYTRRRLRIAFYVQHLLGIGHLARAFRVTEALVEAGWEVDLLVGGVIPAGLAARGARIVPLPPVRAGSSGLSSLVHPDGSPFDEAARNHRRDRLLAHVAAIRPDVLLIEAFPFGRRQMRFELLPLLEATKAQRPAPLIVISVRDILQEARRPERDAETVALIERFFDLVLVHGDPALALLDRTFPRAGEFAAKIAYTGLVAPSVTRTGSQENPFDVIVSAGGGAVGGELLHAALAARPLTRFSEARWLLLTGPNLPEADRRRLDQKDAPGVTIMDFVPGLAGLLSSATVSISQAGYNTVADLLVSRCPAVLVPFAAGGETEQTVRASLLADRNRVAVVAEANLDPAHLAAAIDRAVALPGLTTRFKLDGAARSAALLREALEARRASDSV